MKAGASPPVRPLTRQSRRRGPAPTRVWSGAAALAFLAACAEREVASRTTAPMRSSATGAADDSASTFEADVHFVHERPKGLSRAIGYHMVLREGATWTRTEVSPPALPLQTGAGDSLDVPNSRAGGAPWTRVRRLVLDTRDPHPFAELADGRMVPLPSMPIPTLPGDPPLPMRADSGGRTPQHTVEASVGATRRRTVMSAFVRREPVSAAVEGRPEVGRQASTVSGQDAAGAWPTVPGGYEVLRERTLVPPGPERRGERMRLIVLQPRFVARDTVQRQED